MRKLKETALYRDERGGPMAEYLPLLALISVVVIFAITLFGGAVSDLLGGGECPDGSFEKTHIMNVAVGDKKDALAEDDKGNGDGVVCWKEEAHGEKGLPGEGNTGKNANVKDNNS